MKEAGFTLIELIIVVVVVGVLSAYAMMRNGSASVFSLLSQAQTMASDIKHVQSMATVWGKSLRISAAGDTYSVSCKNGGTTPPCNSTSPVINPATGTDFAISLQKGVFLSTYPATLDIDSLGQPALAATYVLKSRDGNVSVNVTVAPLTGHVTVTP